MKKLVVLLAHLLHLLVTLCRPRGVRGDARRADEAACIEDMLNAAISNRVRWPNAQSGRPGTPAVMEQVEANVASLVEAHNTLRATMKKLYPKTKFVSVELKALPDDTTSA